MESIDTSHETCLSLHFDQWQSIKLFHSLTFSLPLFWFRPWTKQQNVPFPPRSLSLSFSLSLTFSLSHSFYSFPKTGKKANQTKNFVIHLICIHCFQVMVWSWGWKMTIERKEERKREKERKGERKGEREKGRERERWANNSFRNELTQLNECHHHLLPQTRRGKIPITQTISKNFPLLRNQGERERETRRRRRILSKRERERVII